MTREFQITNGLSLRDLDLAFFDPVPREGIGSRSLHRQVYFLLANEPGRRLTVSQREFTGVIRAIAREGDLSHQTEEWKIEGMGGFSPPSPYFHERAKENKLDANGPFKAIFNHRTRKGTLIFPA